MEKFADEVEAYMLNNAIGEVKLINIGNVYVLAKLCTLKPLEDYL